MADPQIRSGAHVERYEVQEYLGRRSLGAVYRGYDRSVARSVAIEFLDTLTSPEAKRRFASEAPKLVALHHPHLLQVIGFGEYGEVPYLVYDYVRGGSLADLLGRRRLSRDESLHVLGGVAGAVDEAHRNGVLHGDLEPSNVLLGPDGGALVSGFGLTPLAADGPRGSADDPGAGTAGFIAPEEAARGEFTAAADRYSFAAIAYDVLTGSPPFTGQSSAEVLNAQQMFDPPLATTRNPGLGPATDQVLRRGVAREPEGRWPSCTQMSDALADALSGAAPASAEAEPRGRRGWVYVGVAVLLLALLGGLGAVLWSRTHQTPTPGITLSESAVTQGGSLIVNGSQLPANQVGTVQLESSPQQIGAFQADQNGNTTVRVTIPEATYPGGHVVSLCWQNACHTSAKLTVTERPPSPSPASPSPSPSPTPTSTPTPTPTPSPTPSPKSAPSTSPSAT